MCISFLRGVDICEDCTCCLDDEFFPDDLTESKALICLILNCIPFTSGFGTILSVCFKSRNNANRIICLGLAQFILTFMFFGWILSIMHGIKLYAINQKDELVVQT